MWNTGRITQFKRMEEIAKNKSGDLEIRNQANETSLRHRGRITRAGNGL